jgi:hypothetical protein
MTPTPAELTRPPRPQDPPSGEGRHPQRPSSPFADPFGSCPSRPETSFTGERFRGGQSTVRDPLRRAANRGWARKTTADAGWDGSDSALEARQRRYFTLNGESTTPSAW